MDLTKTLEASIDQKRGARSNRVLKCTQTGEQASLTEFAEALAEKYTRDAKAVRISLTKATRDGVKIFGLNFELVEGTPFKAYKPREKKEETEPKTKNVGKPKSKKNGKQDEVTL